jgi:FKBP-type peptidyl-prolyl cis-trans isomerase FkpA
MGKIRHELIKKPSGSTRFVRLFHLLGLGAKRLCPSGRQRARRENDGLGFGVSLTSRRPGASPLATDKVKVHYRGTFPDGKEFDSSYKRNQPIDFPLNGVIACWTEGVQMMKVGGKAKLTCPPAIAYGVRGAGGVIPPNATLQFEVELIAIAGK